MTACLFYGYLLCIWMFEQVSCGCGPQTWAWGCHGDSEAGRRLPAFQWWSCSWTWPQWRPNREFRLQLTSSSTCFWPQCSCLWSHRSVMEKTCSLHFRKPRTAVWSWLYTSQRSEHMETSPYGKYVLERILLRGLRKSLCVFQVPSQRDESELLLNLPPDRIGHGTFLHPEVGGSDSLVEKVCKQNIPIGKSFPS